MRSPPRTDGVRCRQCHKKVAERLAGELHIVCPRCHTQQVVYGDGKRQIERREEHKEARCDRVLSAGAAR